MVSTRSALRLESHRPEPLKIDLRVAVAMWAPPVGTPLILITRVAEKATNSSPIRARIRDHLRAGISYKTFDANQEFKRDGAPRARIAAPCGRATATRSTSAATSTAPQTWTSNAHPAFVPAARTLLLAAVGLTATGRAAMIATTVDPMA
jgi:hypothetical protein